MRKIEREKKEAKEKEPKPFYIEPEDEFDSRHPDVELPKSRVSEIQQDADELISEVPHPRYPEMSAINMGILESFNDDGLMSVDLRSESIERKKEWAAQYTRCAAAKGLRNYNKIISDITEITGLEKWQIKESVKATIDAMKAKWAHNQRWLAMSQFYRLQYIADKSISDGNFGMAIKAIDLQNKIGHVYQDMSFLNAGDKINVSFN